jgi:hypothetical protein
MREKMFAIGDDFWVETGGGERAFNVNGKALRIRDTVVESPEGEELRNVPETFVAIVVIALLAVVLDFVWKRARGEPPAGAAAHLAAAQE